MVILTQPWCEACTKLIQSVNAGAKAKHLFDSFVISHAYGDDALANWQPTGENYVPQVLFFDADGNRLDVRSPYTQHKHFFVTDEELADGMARALRAEKASNAKPDENNQQSAHLGDDYDPDLDDQGFANDPDYDPDLDESQDKRDD